jgi:hypothetical protein
MYDLLAKRVRAYAYVYPFIELGLGLAYLAFLYPVVTYIVTIIIFSFGALGVLDSLRRGLDLGCPCMGSVLKVPLSTVSLVENIGMSLMALAMLIMRWEWAAPNITTSTLFLGQRAALILANRGSCILNRCCYTARSCWYAA